MEDGRWSIPRESYAAGCLISLAGISLTLMLHHRSNCALRVGTSFSAKRFLYQLITGLAPAIALVNFLAATSPPLHRAALLSQHIAVACVMGCFMELLLLLLFRTALAEEVGTENEATLPAISNIMEHLDQSFSTWSISGFEPHIEPSRYIKAAVGILRQQQPIAFWASPPIGCCFALCPSWSCGQPRLPSARLIALLRRAVLVYVAGAVIAPLLELWLAGLPGMSAHMTTAARATHVLEGAVTLAALYALFITYRLSHKPLHEYRTTLKFAAVKVLVFAAPLQRGLLVGWLGQVGLWWQHVLTVAESPLLSLLLCQAFPPSELPRSTSALASTLAEDETARLVPNDDP